MRANTITTHAIADYSAALKLDTKNSFAFARRGIAEEAQKNYVHAIADYGAAVALNPKDAGSLYFRGMATCAAATRLAATPGLRRPKRSSPISPSNIQTTH